jgi:hypothetical protein
MNMIDKKPCLGLVVSFFNPALALAGRREIVSILDSLPCCNGPLTCSGYCIRICNEVFRLEGVLSQLPHRYTGNLTSASEKY